MQVAGVSVPAVQELVPDTVKPGSHAGAQVAPLAREAVQAVPPVPTLPFVGAVEASQGLAAKN